MKFRPFFLAALVALAGFAALPAAALAAPVIPQPDAVQLGNAIMANNLQLNTSPAFTNFTEQPIVSVPPSSAAPTSGIFSAPFLGFPTGADDVDTAVLTTGDVADIENANQGLQNDATYYDNVHNHGAVANDVTTLQLRVTVPPAANCVAFDYRFLSEEFPVYVGSAFNDAFIAGIDANDWNNEEPYSIFRPHDIAADPSGKPVSVNGVGPTAMFPVESQGTIFNAASGLITSKSQITPGDHTIYFSIFDASDHIYDSAVFIDNLRFISESAATCKPPLAQDLAPPAVAPPAPSNQFTLGSKVVYGKGTTNVIVTVPAPGVVSAGPAAPASGAGVAAVASAERLDGVAAAKKKKKAKKKPALIKTTKVNALAAGPVIVKIKPTAAGKKVLKQKGKFKVKVRFTFTPTGGTPATQTKTITIKASVAKKKGN